MDDHNTLRKHLTCTSGEDFESSFHMLYKCDALVTHISFWAQARWTQRILEKIIQDQSWPLVMLKDFDKVFPREKGGIMGPFKKGLHASGLWQGSNTLYVQFNSIQCNMDQNMSGTFT